jgi:hypothetical protein
VARDNQAETAAAIRMRLRRNLPTCWPQSVESALIPKCSLRPPLRALRDRLLIVRARIRKHHAHFSAATKIAIISLTFG